jgi:hypothetical protein
MHSRDFTTQVNALDAPRLTFANGTIGFACHTQVVVTFEAPTQRRPSAAGASPTEAEAPRTVFQHSLPLSGAADVKALRWTSRGLEGLDSLAMKTDEELSRGVETATSSIAAIVYKLYKEQVLPYYSRVLKKIESDVHVPFFRQLPHVRATIDAQALAPSTPLHSTPSPA